MKSTLLKSVFMIAVLSSVLSGCVNSDNYDAPNAECVDPSLVANKTVKEVIDAVKARPAPNGPAVPTVYEGDDIIEAYVTSSDEKGNIYKSISFQTIPVDGTAPLGFSVPINVTSTFGKGFIPGRKVYIKLKGLYTAIVYGSLQIGQLYQSSPSAAPEIGRISENEFQNFLFPICTTLNENDFIRTLSVADAVKDANLNTLIELDNVQFAESSLNRTLYDVDSGGGSTNQTVVATTGGTPLIVRISSFAPFSGKPVPSGSGKIRGVLTKYNTDYQFMIRYETDLRLNGPRVDVNPPVVGNDIQYLGAFTENFESYTPGTGTAGQFNFPKYINDPVVGSKLWKTRSLTNNKYIEMSSFGSPAEKNRTLFFVPVDMTAASTFSFQNRTNFFVQNALKVYYTTNYTPGMDVSKATLVDISANFAYSTANTSTAAFTNSGVYNIPAGVTGNGFFVFEYTGTGLTTPAQTTNMQIDNITVN